MRLLGRGEIACQQWTELITDYLEGALPRGLVRSIDRHLAGCPHCTEYLAQMRRTIHITGSIDSVNLAEDVVPGELLDAMQKAFEDYHRRPR
jgi:anti-sigma factor RsiW